VSKRQKTLIYGLITVFLLSAALLFSNNSSKLISFDDKNVTPTPDIYDQEVIGESVIVSISPSPSSMVSIASDDTISTDSTQTSSYKVVKVVDGDTMDVNVDGKVERLRLIGIDTPETVDPRKPVQCFGKAASDKAKELLTGQSVTLEADPTQGERDKYKRLLRYVFLPDGTSYNLYMISEGYAHEYTYDKPYKDQAEYKQAEIDARNNNRGLWSPDTCNGNK
jgi:micrococcal nuclease